MVSIEKPPYQPYDADEVPDGKLTIICAMPGAGKTYYLRNLEWQAKPSCRITLEKEHKNPATLVNHVHQSLMSSLPMTTVKGKSMPENWTQYIERPLLVTIDNLHYLDEVTDTSEISLFLNRLIAQVIDKRGQIAIASRTFPGLLGASLLTSAEYVTYKDLRLTDDEIDNIASRYQTYLTADDVEYISGKAEGWAVGIISLIAQKVLRFPVNTLHPYFKEIFDEVPLQIQQLLLKTCHLEEISEKACTNAIGEGDWGNLITDTVKLNLFTDWIPHPDYIKFRYHPLFQSFLIRYLQELPGIAQIKIKGGDYEGAYRIYRKMDDNQAIVKLIEVAGLEMWRDGHQQVLLTWINQLPESIADSGIVMLYRSLIERNFGRVQVALSLQDKAIERLSASPDQGQGIKNISYALVWRGVTWLMMADYRKSLDDAEKVLSLNESNGDAVSIIAAAYRVKGLSLYHTGQIDTALTFLRKSFDSYQAMGYLHDRAIVAQDIGAVYADMVGLKREAEHYHQIAYDYWHDKGDSYRLSAVLNDLGVVYFLHGDYYPAFVYMERAVKLARDTGYRKIEAYALAGLGDIYSCLGEAECACEAYEEAYEIAYQISDSSLMIYIRSQALILASRQGSTKQMESKLGELSRLSTGSLYQSGLRYMAMGYAYFRLGNQKMAEELISESLSVIQPLANTTIMAAVKFLRGIIYSEVVIFDYPISAGVIVLAQSHLDDIKPNDNNGIFLDDAIAFKTQLPILRQRIRGIEAIVKRKKHHLEVKVLGEFSVFLDESQLDLSREAKLLLYHLIVAHSGLTTDEIGLLFWPDDTARYVEGQVRYLLKSIRRAIGKDSIVHKDGRYTFNRFINHKCDLVEFQGIVNKASLQSDSQERVGLYKQSLSIYNTPSSLVVPYWPHGLIDALRESATNACRQVGLSYREKEDYVSSLDFYLRGICINPLAEDIYRSAMELYSILGNNGEIARLFNNCKSCLEDEVGMPPSGETIRLFNKLVKGGKDE